MTEKLVKKHDELAKKFLGNLSVAKEFLLTHLPPEIARKCDFSTLEINTNSFIDNELRQSFSDIVYRVKLLDGIGYAYIHTLIEHQSSAVKLMPLRILKYQLEIISKHVEEYGESAPLPLVIPFVFYNGTASPYPYSTDIRNLVVDSDLFAQIGLGKFKLIDLTVTDDNEILQHKKLAVLEMVLKHIRVKEFVQAVEPIVQALINAHAANLPKDLFDSMLSYLTKAKEEEELAPLFKRIIIEISEYKEDIMTYAEHYTQKGIQQGRQEGKYDAQQNLALKLLLRGYDIAEVAEDTELPLAEVKKLQKTIKH